MRPDSSPRKELSMPASVVTVAGLLLSVAGRSAQDVKAELDKLQGTWVGVAATRFGKPIPEDVTKARLVIEGRDHTRTAPDGRKLKMQVLGADPRKSPKRIELRDHPDVPRESPLNIPLRYWCVYEIEGDTLKLCIALGSDRTFPTKIEQSNPEYVYVEWKRMMKK